MIYCIDLDGTLIDSFERHYILLENLILEQLMPVASIDKSEYLKYKCDGYSTKDYCQTILGLDQEKAELLSETWIRHIEDTQYIDLDRLYSDTIPFLNKLSKSNNKIVFLSARTRKPIILDELRSLNILSYASEIYIVSPLNAVKDKRDVVQNLLKQGDVCMIGDTEVEYLIAKELGLKFFILNRGFRSKSFWDRQGVYTISSLEDIKIE